MICVAAFRELVRAAQQALQPEEVRRRKRNRLKRKAYSCRVRLRKLHHLQFNKRDRDLVTEFI